LLANALGQSMHQCVAKSISRASALLQAINCAFGFLAGPEAFQTKRFYGGSHSLRIGREAIGLRVSHLKCYTMSPHSYSGQRRWCPSRPLR
jgi:hypothetical protein